MYHLSINAVRSEALFVSALQRSDTPRPGQVQQAIAQAVREFGSRGCAAWVAQEFGDHPETAVERMRWARQVVEQAFGATRLQAAHAHRLVSSVVAHATYAA
jgi:hypothetical protein